MTFEEFAEALRAEGFTRRDVDDPSSKRHPVVFSRPLTGQIYCARTGQLDCRLSPNGYRGDPTWTGMAHALESARKREV